MFVFISCFAEVLTNNSLIKEDKFNSHIEALGNIRTSELVKQVRFYGYKMPLATSHYYGYKMPLATSHTSVFDKTGDKTNYFFLENRICLSRAIKASPAYNRELLFQLSITMHWCFWLYGDLCLDHWEQ